MPLILSGSVDISGSMTATTIVVSAPGGGGMVSSSQQIQNYNLFAVTSSANTFYGNQTINGTLGVLVGGVSELNVQQTGVTLGNVVTDTHRVTGSANISGSLIVTGSISTTETISMPSPFMFRNKIINGAMMIDQRNDGGAVTLADGFAVDRFHHYEDGADFTARRSTLVPSGSGFINSLSITNGTGVSMAAGNYTTIRHGIEGFNTADLNWGTSFAKSITISFWVRSSLTGTFGLALRNNANNYGYVVSYSISLANTWEYITKTIPGPTSGTWNTGNERGIFLIWDLGAGTTYSIAAGTWTSASEILGLTGGTKFRTTTGATYYLTGVQLEVGNVATPFEHRNYSVELQLCKRYFQRWGSGVTWQAGQTGTSGGAYDYFKFIGGGMYSGGTMRTTPDITYLDDTYFMGIGAATGTYSDLGTITAANMGSLSLSNTPVAMQRLGIWNITTIGGTRGVYYASAASTEGFIGLTAEIS